MVQAQALLQAPPVVPACCCLVRFLAFSAATALMDIPHAAAQPPAD